MRLSDSITLPAQVERARVAGELIVFAGAGVSMGPPSNLPGFAKLARDIAHPRIAWSEKERFNGLDRYLGRAQRAGVDVQARARVLLDVPGTHTSLHEHLLGSFGSVDRVRLITTNFDSHFTSAARAVFGTLDLPHYWGPALPPGRDFRGIAHLHGALSRPSDRLVLSDSDFASAYMADGWAARFLVGAFADRTVLFVGYSVTDPLLRYLLLALPRTDRWFGLWPNAELRAELDHPITTIGFELSQTGDPYRELSAAMGRWKWYASAPASAHGAEMKRVTKDGPPSSPIDTDYLRARLGAAEGRRSFMLATTEARWLHWAAEQGFLDCLTTPKDESPAAWEWCAWCAQNFANGADPALLKVLRGRPTELNPALVTWLVRSLSAANPLGDPIPTRQFVALLATQPKSSIRDGNGWFWLAAALTTGGRYAEALALLRTATRVSLRPLERVYLSYVDEKPDAPPDSPAVSMGVVTLIDAREILGFLEGEGKKLAEVDPEALLGLAEQRLAEAYEVVELARSASGTADYLSFGRTAIAPSNQDAAQQAEDVLVILVRLVLDRWAASDQDRLAAFARSRDTDSRNLLRRLALYAYANMTHVSGDDFLTRAAELRWASDIWVRPEFFLALEAHFAAASEPGRAKYVSHLADDANWDPPIDEHSEHARFSLAQRLARLAPGSEASLDFAAGQRKVHAGFREGDPDGFLSRVEVGWGGDEPSPISADELLSLDAETVSRRILDVIAENAKRGGGGSHSLIALLQQTARSNPTWAFAVCKSACLAADEQSGPVLDALLWGLREVLPAPAGASEFLRSLSEGPREIPLHAFGHLIMGWARNVDPSDVALCDALDYAADFAYEHSTGTDPGIQNHGWTETALNHPGGHAAHVWWAVASARNKAGGEFILSIDDRERRRWERVATGAGMNASAARPVLGMATERLIPGDTPWAEAMIVPTFDPTSGREQAAQLWDGRLMQSRWGIPVLNALRPHRHALFAESATLIPHRAKQLGDWVSMLAAEPQEFNFDLMELHEFTLGATPEARGAFARSIPEHLARLVPELRVIAWKLLLKPYWADRRTGMPTAFDREELAHLPMWVVALGEVADEAASELSQTQAGALEHAAGILWQWKENADWIAAHPMAACVIVEFLAKAGAIQSWDADDAVHALQVARDHGADEARVCSVAQRLVSIPSVAAVALVARLNCKD